MTNFYNIPSLTLPGLDFPADRFVTPGAGEGHLPQPGLAILLSHCLRSLYMLTRISYVITTQAKNTVTTLQNRVAPGRYKKSLQNRRRMLTAGMPSD